MGTIIWEYGDWKKGAGGGNEMEAAGLGIPTPAGGLAMSLVGSMK
jgi:hypothetical protein